MSPVAWAWRQPLGVVSFYFVVSGPLQGSLGDRYFPVRCRAEFVAHERVLGIVCQSCACLWECGELSGVHVVLWCWCAALWRRVLHRHGSVFLSCSCSTSWKVVFELRWRSLVDVEFDKLGMDWSGAGTSLRWVCVKAEHWLVNRWSDCLLTLTTRGRYPAGKVCLITSHHHPHCHAR